MHVAAFLALVAAVLGMCAGMPRSATSLQQWAPASLMVRGGAKRGSSSPSRRRGSSSKRSLKSSDEDDRDNDGDGDSEDSRGNGGDEDEEGDGEDEDEEPERKRRGRSSSARSKRKSGRRGSSSGGKKGRKARHRNQLVKWGETYGKASAGLRDGLREKLEELAKQSHTVYKDAYRRAKVLRSSAFEAMLLRATWPGDDAVPQDLLDEIVKHSIPAFKYGRGSAEDDPYHMMMHKLWTKMCEKDWRTVVKSLYILHCVSRDCSVDACSRFALAIKDMSKVRNPKNPEHKYFDLALIREVDDASATYEPFVGAYAAYVMHRSKTFSNKYEELKEISDQTHEKQAVARLKRAVLAMQLGLRCVVEDRDQQNVITGHACKQVANDLRDCWKHFTSKLAPLAGGDVAPYGGAKAEEKDVVALLQFYRDAGKDIKVYLSKALKAYGPLRVKVPSEIESKFLPAADFEEKLAARAAALTTNLSGGASKGKGGKPSAREVAKSVEDEEDDEEEEEEEEEEEDEDEEGSKSDKDKSEEDDEDESDDEDDEDEEEDDEEEDDNNEEEDDEDVEVLS